MESHPGLAVEAMYSEAVLAFNKKNTDEALKVVEEILKLEPNHVQALELKALSLKSKGEEEKSIGVYEQLIKLKPEKETGPYHFELGVIYNKQKKTKEAREHFEKAVQAGFNEASSHLFLGLITFNQGDFAAAQDHFSEVKGASSMELRVVARFYLGLINFKNGYSAGGMAEMAEARSIAKDLPDSKIAQDILKGANQVLEPFNVSHWFANASASVGFDSNATQVATGINNPLAPSEESTGKLSISAGGGWMASPLSTIQLVPSYRFATNRNTNSKTHPFEFATNTLSLFMNYKPLSLFTGGVKLEGNYMFNNAGDPDTNPTSDPNKSFVYQKYNGTIETGPYLKYQVSRNLTFQLNSAYRRQRNWFTPGQTGSVESAGLSASYTSSSSYLNPSGGVSYENADVEDTQFSYGAFNANISDSMRLTAKDTLSLSLSYLGTTYSKNTQSRNDKNFVLGANFMHLVNAHWSILADMSYTSNSSNVDVFGYSRFQTSVGAGWTL